MDYTLPNTSTTAKSGPLVTIIICVYNAGSFLRPSLLSVLNQTYCNLEVLIVDDGSTDRCFDSISDVHDARIRILQQTNLGKPAAMNRAIEAMNGEFYAVQDADDLSDHRRIETQLQCMLDNPDVAAVFCGNDLILKNRRMAPLSRFKDRERCRRDIAQFRMPAHDPTGMYRCSMVQGIQYEPLLSVGEGLDYILRIGERFPMMVVGDCLYSYRVHLSSITKRDPTLREKDVETVLRSACARRGIGSNEVFRPSRTRWCGKYQRADNNLAANFIESVLDQRRAGSRWGAVRTGWACSCLHPLELHYHKAFAYAVAPMWLIRWLRQSGS